MRKNAGRGNSRHRGNGGLEWWGAQRTGWEKEDPVPSASIPLLDTSPSKGSSGILTWALGTHHSDRHSDQVSPAPDFEREESGSFWEEGPLH